MGLCDGVCLLPELQPLHGVWIIGTRSVTDTQAVSRAVFGTRTHSSASRCVMALAYETQTRNCEPLNIQNTAQTDGVCIYFFILCKYQVQENMQKIFICSYLALFKDFGKIQKRKLFV